ncbi:Protein ABTS-3 b [Aphelenchoides avenae]|nr:Protein ABTS-3 b [Aphelenchus avenae]
MDIQEPEFTSEQVRSVLFTQDAGNQFHILSRTVQSICTTGTVGGSFDYDQTWICALCMLNTVQHRHVAIARLSHPTNLGRTMQDLRFIIIVIAPSRAKGTKTALETTRTFATLFADMDIRQRLVMAPTVEVFRATLLGAAKELALEQSQWRERKASIHLSQAKEHVVSKCGRTPKNA